MADYNLVEGEQMSADQVAQLLLNSGFDANTAAEFVAIAKNESGYNAGVVNDTPATGDYSVGLFQINYYDGLATDRTAEFGTPQQLAGDPNSQAFAAATLFGQSGFSPWQADFPLPSANLAEGQQAVADAQGGRISGPTPNAVLTAANKGPSTTYKDAGSAVGKILQYIDGFFNPRTTVVPAWSNIFGTNETISMVFTIVDRSLGFLFGAGLVYIGIRLLTGGGQSDTRSIAPTIIRAGSDVYTGRALSQARQVTAQGRVQTAVISAQRSAQSGAEQTQRTIFRAAQTAASQQATREREQTRQAEADRKFKLAQRRADTAERAENRRSAETRRVGQRRTERTSRA